ncbi:MULTISPECIES: type I methionyl aminopeptidase [Bacillota]|jgi:methionyl aminopeptidase|uniref:Methionine aminopeptidase n=2 Tax=Amedibacillus TaxID=2749846 RepID=A0A7G9GT75_9FIRM|nr:MULTISPECIES: type I methionyl aminopeptidase [Bacillota]QNM14007.1 type I methionyl aminopeptidase [[Eubacterium] hominis]MCH4285894.1 type I methionyl aminopeptidase [Amedibacillus hominis]RGB50184.1 type I methionyl aminopeptidase [Absiella sp. AM22-9]RGB56954.1 type I methionyl aminopeptidase [Absiella sp. AM10-20]RGB66842.1 type I methionyl aminopeptidase [Absiella sp. AM09-45]
MIRTKADNELEYMREAGKIVALAHQAVKDAIKAGISTKQINEIVENVIMEHDAYPSFKNLYGFPAATCVSVNNVLVHGIPDDTVLQDGDIVSVDIGACYHGYHGDSAWTYAVGNVSKEVQTLLHISEESLYEGLKQAKAGNHLTDISHAIGEFVYRHGFSVPRDYAGHGIGTSVHEDPTVPNFGPAGHGILLKEGMTLAIEPMVLAGRPQTKVLADGWGVISKDGSLSAHYEHTIVITKNGYEILTTLNKEERPDNG